MGMWLGVENVPNVAITVPPVLSYDAQNIAAVKACRSGGQVINIGRGTAREFDSLVQRSDDGDHTWIVFEHVSNCLDDSISTGNIRGIGVPCPERKSTTSNCTKGLDVRVIHALAGIVETKEQEWIGLSVQAGR